MELWDIYDENKQPTGRTMKRNDWHMKPGEFHLTVLGVIEPEGIVGFVQIRLAAAALDIIAELHPTKTEGVAELRRRHVTTIPVVHAHPRRIRLAPVRRDVFQLVQPLGQQLLGLSQVGAGGQGCPGSSHDKS